MLYDHLKPGHIRLLRVGGETDVTGSVSCELLVALLTDCSRAKYMALSYTWGPETPTHSVTVNGYQVSVRSNLYHVLQQISRRSDGFKVGELWWIDSICINQEDNHEKENQVAMMGKIYRLAERTATWLGEADSTSHWAMEILKELGQIKSFQASRAKAFHEEKMGSLEIKAVGALFQRPWFCRAWTLQEYILSEELTLVCGEQAIGRLGFERSLKWLTRYRGFTMPKIPGFRMAWKRRKIRRRLFANSFAPSGFPLCDLLVYAGGSTATIARDCVFSLLGLVSDVEELGVELQYEKSRDDSAIFEQLTRSQIRTSDCLDIICFGDAGPRDAGLRCPSWVPYWPNHDMSTANDHMAWQSFRELAHMDGKRKSSEAQEKALFRASRTLQPLAQSDSPGPGLLVCNSKNLGRIQDLGACHSIVDEENTFFSRHGHNQHVAETADQELSRMRVSCAYHPPERLWATVLLDRGDDSLDTYPCSGYAHEFTWLCKQAIWHPEVLPTEVLLWFRSNAHILFQDEPHGAQIIRHLRSTTGRDMYQSEFEKQMVYVSMTMKKRLMISDRGTWGMAPMRARRGDRVCLLAGCNYPVVVRETESPGFYTMIGECYVEGCMQGEAATCDGVEEKEWNRLFLV